MSIGEVIKRERLARGMTQKELAAASGSTEVTICRYELGERIPKVTHLQSVAAGLGVKASELIAMTEVDE